MVVEEARSGRYLRGHSGGAETSAGRSRSHPGFIRRRAAAGPNKANAPNLGGFRVAFHPALRRK